MSKPYRFMPAWPQTPAYGWVYPAHTKPPAMAKSRCSWCGSDYVKKDLPSGSVVFECPHCDRACTAQPPCKLCWPEGTGR